MKVFSNILKNVYLLLVVVILAIVFSVLSPSFRTWQNLINIGVQNAWLVVATIGVALIMASGNVDMSVSYQIGLTSVCVGKLMIDANMPVVFAVLIGLILSAFLGFINGYLSVFLKVHSMVTTLATMTAFQGAAFLISNARTFFNLPQGFKNIGQEYIGPIPVCVLIALAAVVIGWILFNKSHFGRKILALGGNPEATRLAGINISRLTVASFIVAGLFIGVAAILLTARLGSGTASIAPSAMFDCMTACILGGISIGAGSRTPKIVNVVLGVFVVAILSNGMQMLGMNTYIQYVAQGIILALAIAIDNRQREAAYKKAAKNA